MTLYTVSLDDAEKQFPEFSFISAMPPSAQKAAFHVKDREGHDVCLKLVSPDYEIGRLDREIQAMQNISHPNVVSLLEYTYSAKPNCYRHFLVEEFVEGSDLTASIGSPWNGERAVSVFSQLLDGLEALHNIRVVHRDIKPSNIRMRPGDTPVLIDFGLARHLDLPDITETYVGAQIGTVRYFSPEQFTGNKHDIDTRTDLFAIGIVLYEALVGGHPFWRPSMTRVELQQAVCHSEDYRTTVEFRRLPDSWRILIERLLAKERFRRPYGASMVASMIRKMEDIL